MSQATSTAQPTDLESGEVKGMFVKGCPVRPAAEQHHVTCILGSASDHRYRDDRQSPQNQQSQPTQAEFDRDDSSWPLYSLYSKIAEEEDKMKTERYQKDADATLIFVSPHVNFSFACRTQPEDIGWFILGHPRRIYWSIVPRPETKPSGCRCVLSHADL